MRPRNPVLAYSVVVALALCGGVASGHDSSTPYASWMESLMKPDYPLSSCCGTADQYYVREYRSSLKHGVAFSATVLGHDGQPDFAVEIPQEKVIWDRVNPTGRGVVFIYDGEWGREVVCFVSGIGI